jgi:uncharacterized protein YwqG
MWPGCRQDDATFAATGADDKVSFLGRLFGAAAHTDSPAGQGGAAQAELPGDLGEEGNLGGRRDSGGQRDLGEPGGVRASWAAATGLPSVELFPGPEPTGLTDSKIGGLPYLGPGDHWPALSDGGPKLFLLAQLNLGALPPVAGFPQSGLLQFFIAGDDTHGMNYRDPVAGPGHMVRFHPDLPSLSPAVPDESDVLAAGPDLGRAVEYMDVPFTVTEGVRLHGRITSQPMPPGDFRFDATASRFALNQPMLQSADAPMLAQSGGSAVSSAGHRMGGYAHFAHSDPRLPPHLAGFTTLLLQLDSDDSAGISWGDGGTCGFFIEPERLAARDFSRVLYCWDCA